jgi:hypothetical protein
MRSEKHRIRRAAFTIVACTIVGAVISVGVAWYAEMRERWAETHVQIVSPAPTEWPLPVPATWRPPFSAFREDRWGSVVLGLGSGTMWVEADGTAHSIKYEAKYYRAGWPLLALGGGFLRGSDLIGDRLHGDWRLDWTAGSVVNLPLIPLWPGFALNTLFYAALAWGLWQVPIAIRRRCRRKAGRCDLCGYDLQGIAAGSPCPECGTGRGSGE